MGLYRLSATADQTISLTYLCDPAKHDTTYTIKIQTLSPSVASETKQAIVAASPFLYSFVGSATQISLGRELTEINPRFNDLLTDLWHSARMPDKYSEKLESSVTGLFGGGHYREIAIGLLELARQCRFPNARRELVSLASIFHSRADRGDARLS